MKKIILFPVLAAVVAGAIISGFLLNSEKTRVTLQSGGSFEDFIVGLKNSSPVTLKNFAGKEPIILAFTDSSPRSKKFLERFDAGIRTLKESGRIFICFLITKNGEHAVIEEKTRAPSLMYRMPYSRIPDVYTTLSFPLIVHIGKDGYIKLVYSGYSPTIFYDIAESLKDN